MSYEIIYDKQFIKAEKDNKVVFFPMILWGSNNCTDFRGRNGAERRERHWHNFSYHLNGNRFGTLEEMLASVDAEREKTIASNKERNEQYRSEGNESWIDEYDDKRWGYFTGIAIGGACTRRTSFACYRNIFVTGCKKALTVEELAEVGVRVRLFTGSFYYMKEVEKRYQEAGKEEIDYVVKSSKDLLEKLDEFKEYLKDFPEVTLYIDISEENMSRVRKLKFPTRATRVKQRVEVKEYFVLAYAGGYLYKRTTRGFKYTPYADAGKRFISHKEAENYLKRANKSSFFLSKNFQIEKVEREAAFYI